MFDEIMDNVHKLHCQLMLKNGRDKDYRPKIAIYVRPDAHNEILGNMPKGFSYEYEIVQNKAIQGYPYFVVSYNYENHPPYLVVDTQDKDDSHE